MEENIPPPPPQSSSLDNNNNHNNIDTDIDDDVARAHPCLLLMSTSSSQKTVGKEEDEERKNLIPLRQIYEDHILPHVDNNKSSTAANDDAPHLVQFTKSVLRQIFDAAFFCQVVLGRRAAGRQQHHRHHHHQCLDEEIFKTLTMDDCFIDVETGCVKLKLSRSNRCHETNIRQQTQQTTTATVVKQIAKIGYRLLTGRNEVDSDDSDYSSQNIPERLRDPFLILVFELCLMSQNDDDDIDDDQNDNNNYPRPAPTPTLGFIVSLMYFSGSCVVHQQQEQQYDISKTTFFNRLSLKKIPININAIIASDGDNNDSDTYYYYDSWSTDVAQLSQGYSYLLSSQDSDSRQKSKNDHHQNIMINKTNKTPQEIVKEQLFFFSPRQTSSSSSSSLLDDPCHWGDQIYKELLLAGNAVFERTTTGKFLRYSQQQQKQEPRIDIDDDNVDITTDDTIHDDEQFDDPDFFITAANEEISTRDEYLRNLCILLTSEHDYMCKQLSTSMNSAANMIMMMSDNNNIIIDRRRDIYEGRLGLACMNLAKAVAYFFRQRRSK